MLILNCYPGIPLWTSITWGAKFTTYYCILLCGSSLFSIELAAALVVIKCQNWEVSGVFTYLSPSFLAVTYLTLAVYFFLDWRAPKLLDPPPTGRSNWIFHRIWKYSLCCLGDVLLKSLKQYSGVKFSWTTLYREDIPAEERPPLSGIAVGHPRLFLGGILRPPRATPVWEIRVQARGIEETGAVLRLQTKYSNCN